MTDPRHVDDGLEGKTPGSGNRRAAERQNTTPSEFLKGRKSAPLLDCARYAPGKQQPPGDEVTIPSVHDHLDLLIEQITLDDVYGHILRAFKRTNPPVGVAHRTQR